MFEENEISEKSMGGTEMCKRAVAARIPPELNNDFQVICSRVRKIEEDKIRIYWVHDLPQDPETSHIKDESSRNRFHKIVFCGNWQMNQYVTIHGLPITSQMDMIETPIVPFADIQKSKEGPVRLIYTSTPQRGLAMLVPVFMKLAETNKNIHLDVFSSFAIYGWPDADKQFEPLYQACRDHPQITYHGFAPNEKVREAYEKAHIFAYPSIWPECNSRSLIEAMSAKCLAIHPNLAGLSDTSGNLTAMYQFDQDINVHAQKFYSILEHAIKIARDDETQNVLGFTKNYADYRFNIDRIAGRWEDMMRSLHDQYKDPKSRRIQGSMFKYKAAG